ncbi:hypothetical protein PVAP13_7NG341324 [Panicum virgatum]|uniref:Uncharacterized protein n=1 Tax=Panicum virgatum TaxID=38727 RepID=A0A8T0Q185_PANVG|nr:hypothetical protein PVAP13_7NG341324 [Panicum virgatum]
MGCSQRRSSPSCKLPHLQGEQNLLSRHSHGIPDKEPVNCSSAERHQIISLGWLSSSLPRRSQSISVFLPQLQRRRRRPSLSPLLGPVSDRGRGAQQSRRRDEPLRARTDDGLDSDARAKGKEQPPLHSRPSPTVAMDLSADPGPYPQIRGPCAKQ